MNIRLRAVRLILLIIGVISLAVAIYIDQFEFVKELLSKFLDQELAGYPF